MNLEYLSRVALMSLDMSGSSRIASISSLKKMTNVNENEGYMYIFLAWLMDKEIRIR